MFDGRLVGIVGCEEGFDVGWPEGNREGRQEGCDVGCLDGREVGWPEGGFWSESNSNDNEVVAALSDLLRAAKTVDRLKTPSTDA